jgi:hypothetical protein
MSKRIPLTPLTKGQYAIVDDADYDWLVAEGPWHAAWNESAQGYTAKRCEYIGTVDGKVKNKSVYMHRRILGLPAFEGDRREGDHKNPAATLDNRRRNLRIANSRQQKANTRVRTYNKSGFKGVCRASSGRFKAQIGLNGKSKYLGCRATAEEAHQLYVAAAKEQFGEFARAA